MNFTHITALAVAATAVSAANASITETGEFTGDLTETFEAIAAPGGLPGPVDIFGGAATVNDNLANTLVIATSVASADSDWVSLLPYDGFLMGLVPTGWATFEFDTPVTQFGGYFGSAAIHSGGGVTFFDANGDSIGSASFDVPVLEWTWFGWESEVPIASMIIRASENPSAPLVFDNLQMTMVPAPGALALLACGLFAARRRRN